MKASWRLGTIWGIPVGLHWSMGIVFGLITMSLAVGYFPDSLDGRSPALWWSVAAVTAACFFASILLHELGHAWVAVRRDVPVESITIFVFGGVAAMKARPKSADSELRIAIAGPIVSFALAAVLFLVWFVLQGVDIIAEPALWLARLNLILGLFNLLPGFPLDGGRVLRALVWRVTNDERRATQVAMVSGQLLAFGMIGIGVVLGLTGDLGNGLWFVFLGWFLQYAATAESTGTTVDLALRGVTVADAMGPYETEVPGRMMVRQLIDDHVLPTGNQHFIVTDGVQARGVLTLRDLAQVPRERWDWTPLSQIMKPLSTLAVVPPEMPLLDAMRVMDDARVRQLPVVRDEALLGLLTREEIIHHIRLRMEFAAPAASTAGRRP